MPNDARADAGVAALVAIAEHRVGLVDDHHDRAHRAHHAEHALEVALGLADVLAAEVLEHDRRDADRAGDAGREEALAGADRAAEQIAHRHGVELAALDQLGVVEQALLRGLVADDGVEPPLRLDELEHALRLALDQPLLELAEVVAIEPAAALDASCAPAPRDR